MLERDPIVGKGPHGWKGENCEDKDPDHSDVIRFLRILGVVRTFRMDKA